MTTSILPDPRFPNRPTHPDFADLSAAVIANDDAADNGDFQARIAQYVDFDSLLYMAQNRAVMVGGPDAREQTIVASGILDGFMLGVAYAERKAAHAILAEESAHHDVDPHSDDYIDDTEIAQ